MNSNTNSRWAILYLAVAWTATTMPGAADTIQTRPNILWIMSEDNSKHYLKHFDDGGVETPAIEAMAAHGLTFTRAFSNAPVCSVARTTLITGCYGPRVGTQYHRRMELSPLNTDIQMFPAYLREAGYYTSNNSKEDYNATKESDPWDESGRKASWKNRPTPETPFFHVQTYTDSHESSLHFGEDQLAKPTKTDPDTVPIKQYLPDTALVRFTEAYYRDRMRIIDLRVADLLDRLKAEGQLENTFVFYFGDHGGVLPRSKGYLYESGLHVPLVVRVPDNFQHLVAADASKQRMGSSVSGFVSFIDFAPTVLTLAGLTPPNGLDGSAFLGQTIDPSEVEQRDRTFSYADRFDAKYDFARAIRIGDWKYIRFFQSHQPDSLRNNYRMRMLAYQEWQRLHQKGELSDAQDLFFRPRPVEALYNVISDPDEVRNLAGDNDQAGRLATMRQSLEAQMREINDLSMFPEFAFLESAIEDPIGWGRTYEGQITNYLRVANLALAPLAETRAALMSSMNSGDPLERYWAILALSNRVGSNPSESALAENDPTLVKLLRRRTLDPHPVVAGRASEALAILHLDDPRPVMYDSLARVRSRAEALQLLNMTAYLHEMPGAPYPFDAGKIELPFEPKPKGEIMRRLEFLALADE
ncbi:MAG: sulfatase-like hydrolase/transferase [Planctomycetota bacterium]